MPIPAIIPFLGSAASGVLSFANNNQAREETQRQNRDDRQFQLDMWNRTNDYNSPLQEMQRLKAGGLNPNLVYGGGATTKAQNITPTTSKPLPTPNTGQIFDSVLNTTIDLQLKETQKDVMQMEIFNKAQSIRESETRRKLLEDESPYRLGSIITKSASDTLRYGKEQTLLNNSIDGAKQLVEKQRLENVEKTIKNSFLQEREQQAVYEAYARIKSIKATTENVNVEMLMKQEQLKLRQKGIEVNDNVLVRIFADLLPDSIPNTVKSYFNKNKNKK